MAMQREVVVVSGVRTAIGDFGGGLKDFAPTDLGAQVVREALSRANVSGEEVGQVVFGNVIHTEPKDMYLARVAAINGGVAQARAGADGEPAVRFGPAGNRVGGANHPARRYRHRHRRRRGKHEPRAVPGAGRALGRAHGRRALVDMMLGALHDPFDNIHMGVTAENVAENHEITREIRTRWRSNRIGGRRRRSRGPVQGTDPADQAEDAERRDGLRYRRARARRRDGRGPGEAASRCSRKETAR